MLKLCDIKKEYLSASDKVEALRGVSLSFRKNEFVSILGPSGCGKTTLLNIIGGLDHYTSGDLLIRGKSTKDFKDSDWDTYRNHSIGFVFQSYNLIPHQSVLANVELALTLSGVSKAERRKRAENALKKVGLADQLKKRPNQLSGGQMQRVAIARALVNDPEILLADEPTGALDTTTSVQIMDLLKEISGDRLVIMVTHNPELAEEYSTRIIKLLDGEVTDDSNPYEGEEVVPKASAKKEKKPSMSLFTALSLSMNNLMTKKGRTLLTAFAGSIGIIGIALILSLSNGITAWINSVQEETLSNYPITIQAESVDMSALMVNLMGINQENSANKHDRDAVYSSSVMHEMVNTLNSAQVQTNNLTKFKAFLEKDQEIKKYISNIQYSYDMNLQIYTKDENGKIVKSDVEEMMGAVFEGMGLSGGSASGFASSSAMAESFGFGSIELWQEMLAGEGGKGISSAVTEQYDVIHGAWPKNYNEVVLVVDKYNELSDVVICALGLKTTEEIAEEMKASQRGEILDVTNRSWSYEELCNKEFKIYLPSELYQKQPSGNYILLSDLDNGKDLIYNSNLGVTVKISGIIRPKEDVSTPLINGAVGYSVDLTNHLLKKLESNELVRLQKEKADFDVIRNLPFLPADYVEPDVAKKIENFTKYAMALGTDGAAELYTKIAVIPSALEMADIENKANSAHALMSRQQREEFASQILTQAQSQNADTSEKTDYTFVLEYTKKMSEDDLDAIVKPGLTGMEMQKHQEKIMMGLASLTKEDLQSRLLTEISDGTFSPQQLVEFHDLFVPDTHSESTREQNLKLLGFVEEKSPTAINIYADTFENKDKIAEIISNYNQGKKEEDQIKYTDIVAMMMSGIATIINAISYVLIAFVSISLVVSSIMIGIITYISVLERTKEIGILRAIGASKKDISRVFNAESVIEGFAAGIIGIGITLLLNIPINIIIHYLTDINELNSVLPPAGYLLILISVALSFIAGLFPARFAAKKDPVEALRSE
ncbi:MAG: ABC transporter ATP-binding protein/permease [Ruminococcaceae bacterium]|nr:ABC transporter ATP-binding protein/permease [Oscillospiraceae bacterium]